jgi:Kef-type K+ transport system membrane component KefB
MKNLIPLIRFFAVFALLYWLFKQMMIWINVRMTGWQFIIFVIVLVFIVEYLVGKLNKKGII